ncbi:MAG: phosphate signaling complex protein PhoU [Eubacterium sp.]|nr:phosphate signaling complex protein PhoU [Eubacterium sp.]
MRQVYNEELKMIKEEILLMSTQAERMLSDAITALNEQDIKMAKAAISRDDIVDLKEIQLQQIVSEVIARQQPVASDLRRLSSTYKVITNIERIADLAVNICQKVIELKDEVYFKPLDGITEIENLVERELRICIDAYIDEDISKLDEIREIEDRVDALNHKITEVCIEQISKNPESTLQGLNFSYIGSHLERVGDHATNIFETVYYIVTGNYMDFNDPGIEEE